MADNIVLNPGAAGSTIATDDIGGFHHQRVKISQGADGVAVDVSAAAPLNVTLANTGANATAVKVDGSAVTQPVSGTVAVSGTVPVSQSGTWNLTNITGTVSLPTGSATSAKQPALGTAGTASTDVLTVQGIASMTPFLVNGSGVTQPVSDAGGTLTVDAPVGTPVFVRLSDGTSAITTLAVSLASVPSHAVTNAGTFATQVTSIAAGTNNIGDVDVLTLPAYMPIFVPTERFTSTTATTSNAVTDISAGSGTQMWVSNESVTTAEIIYIKFGTSSGVDATTGAVNVIYPGTFGTIEVPAGTTHMARLSASGSPAFRFMRGNGSL